jgi:hypothetical protein
MAWLLALRRAVTQSKKSTQQRRVVVSNRLIVPLITSGASQATREACVPVR